MRSFSTLVRLLVVLGATVFTGMSARGQCMEDWRLGPESALPGVTGTVYALAMHDDGRGPAVYIGGDFDIAGTAHARNIARWDGHSWEAVGDGLSEAVRVLASYNGELVAGSDRGFQLVPGQSQTLVKYGAGAWSYFPSGDVNSTVKALVVHEGLLYVGGGSRSPVFPSVGDHLFAWNGTSWVRVVWDTTPQVDALTVWNGKVVAGGDGTFGSVAGPHSECVALLNAMRWAPLGVGTGRAVEALTVYNGELIAGGYFSTAGGSAINRVARWDGVSWKPVGPGLGSTSGDVHSLAVHDGQLFVGGDLIGGLAGGESFLLRWDGSAWHSEMSFVGPGAEAIYAMMPMEDRLLVGGEFERLGTWAGYSLMAWRDEEFERVTGGLTYPVEEFFDDDGELLALGQAIDSTSGVARLDETGAEPRWEGVPDDFSGTTKTMIRYGGRRVVGGMFTKVNGTTVNRIAREGELIGWDGMGAGFSTPGSFPVVLALAEFRGELIAGGSFLMSGATTVNRIARWDGSAWQPLGDGLNGAVGAMLVYNDELIVAGSFTLAGGVEALRIAAWNGTSWRAVGAGFGGSVSVLTVFNGELIAGGSFQSTEPGGPSWVARWDGSAWQPMSDEISSRVTALGVHQGRLIAGGLGLWRWDGMAWENLSYVARLPGVGAPSVPLVSINSLMSRGGELLVGGAFTAIPGPTSQDYRVATFFGRWGCAPCKADMDGDGIVDFSDYLAFLNLFDAQDPRADLNGDGIVDFPDYLEFLNAFTTGCA